MALKVPNHTRVVSYERVMIDSARNLIAEKALEGGYDWILYLDDDMTFSPDIFFNLASYDKDIIGALAFKREQPFEPCVYKKREDGNMYSVFPKKMMDVDAIGSAGLLIKTDVLKKIEFPWFETGYNSDKEHFSVDFDFCRKAKEAGFKIWCDPDISMGHIGSPPIIDKKFFKKYYADSKRSNFNGSGGKRKNIRSSRDFEGSRGKCNPSD